MGFLSRMRASVASMGIDGFVACSKMKRRRVAHGYRLSIGLRKDGDDSKIAMGIVVYSAAVKS